MEFKMDLIFRLLVALFLLYVVSKIAATFIRGFFTDLFNGSGKNKIDIDQMIKKQVRILKEAQEAQVKDRDHKTVQLIRRVKNLSQIQKKIII